MSQAPVLCHVDAGVATLTLNRPDVLNALNSELMNLLRDTVQRIATDDSVRAVIITGAGRGFSAGADLGATRPGGAESDAGATLRERYHPTILALRTMNKPVITAVNGVAAGAGMSIALAGDIVLAGQSASFLQAFSKIGLVPDAGSTWFLPRMVGDIRARALMILADKISAEDALRYGIVWKLLPDDQLLAEATRLARHLASMPTRAYGFIKEALLASTEQDLPTQLEMEATLQGKAGKTADFAEGVAAFLAKRPPNFQGR